MTISESKMVSIFVASVWIGLAGLASHAQSPGPAAGAAKHPARPANRVDVPSQCTGVLVMMRGLKIGDPVEEGQVLAQVDDRLARIDLDIRDAQVHAARAEMTAAERSRDEASNRYDAMNRAIRLTPNAVAADDLRAARLTLDRFSEEVKSKEAALRVAESQKRKAALIVDIHQVRSPISGTIRALYKTRGEAVRELESVVQIEMTGAGK
jgi:multidrug efflux pump subunit AcrA (membrane-fusion protein)